MYATEAEVQERFENETFTADELAELREVGFVARVLASGVMDDGVEFIRLRVLDADGVVEEREFCHYDAFADAASYMAAAREVATTSFEERLGPYGVEWEREQMERRGVAA